MKNKKHNEVLETVQKVIRDLNALNNIKLNASKDKEVVAKTLDGDIVLNSKMLKDQKVSKKNIESLKKLYYEKSVLFDKMKKESDVVSLRKLDKEVTKLEYKIQSLWNFKKDRTMHKWFLVPKCICPKQDNYETLGTKYSIVSESCPIHSSNPEILNKSNLKKKMNKLFKNSKK